MKTLGVMFRSQYMPTSRPTPCDGGMRPELTDRCGEPLAAACYTHDLRRNTSAAGNYGVCSCFHVVIPSE